MSMERISDWMRGSVRAELFGASPAGVLNAAAAEGIELWGVRSLGDNALRLNTYENRLNALKRLAGRAGCELRIVRRLGGRKSRKQLLRRPVLLGGLCVTLLLLLVSSLFVWDVEVRGTEKLSRAQVLRTLEECGLTTGSFWPGLDTEQLRSKVMLRLPEIGWMSVNVSGSRAVAAIVERTEKPELYGEEAPSDLIASRDGLIRRMNVLAGKPVAEEGRIVVMGEKLVSGELESLTGEYRRVCAKGAVMADTWYEISAVCPKKEELKYSAGLPRSRFALVFGKRRINLYLSSGKTIDGCDKIISEYRLGWEGLFSTPVRLVRERFVPYRIESGSAWDPAESGRRLYAMLESVTEGQILSRNLSPGTSGELYVLTLRAHCTENIAMPRELPG